MHILAGALRAEIALLIVFLSGLHSFQPSPRPLLAAQSPAPRSCATSEYRQFDFWIGDWDVFDTNRPTTPVAHVKVDRILDGCVVRENYQDTEGLNGQSFSIYDATRRVWHQTWMTSRVRLLTIEGGVQADQIVLTGSDKSPDGQDRLVRGIWKPSGRNISEVAFTSTDRGKNWKLWFDLVFRPRDSASNADDKKIVADLDTQYQAAVKRNDALTMDRILADDFRLVVGSGKTYTKSDLLDDARREHAHYEHQEDTEQTVRVWGDTAVVTAKLWEKGEKNGEPFDYTLWFSDTYVRTPSGWRYVFGQASLPTAATHP